MKQAYQASLFLLALLSALSQDRPPVNGCRLKTTYDQFTDTTTVRCDLAISSETTAGLTIEATASFRGKEPPREKAQSEPTKFWFFLSSNRGGATRQTKPMFQDAPTLHLSLDAAHLEIPLKDYHHVYYELARMYSESARAEIKREEMHKLLAANQLMGKWGSVAFKFNDSTLTALKDFISHQVFVDPTR